MLPSELVAQISNDAPEPEFDPLAAFKKSILKQDQDYPPPSPLMYFVQNGEKFPHRTKKSFSLQQGKQKSKKTTELVLEVVEFIRPTPIIQNIYFECVEPGVVLFFDNEQGESYAARTMKLILNMAGVETHENLIYCDLRELSPTERLLSIEAAIIHTPNVKWVIIDGLVDVMNDFMSAEEAHTLITFLLKLCSKFDIHVTGVLHQNKGLSKDARAHVGSIAGQKCEVEIMVERDEHDSEISVVSAKESRGLPFADFKIKWEKGGYPYIVQELAAPKTRSKKPTNVCQGLEDYQVYKVLMDVYANYPFIGTSRQIPYLELAKSFKVSLEKVKVNIGLNKVKDIVTYCKENSKGWLTQEKEKGPYSLGEYNASNYPVYFKHDD